MSNVGSIFEASHVSIPAPCSAVVVSSTYYIPTSTEYLVSSRKLKLVPVPVLVLVHDAPKANKANKANKATAT